MSLKDIYKGGKSRAESIVSWMDFPEEIPFELERQEALEFGESTIDDFNIEDYLMSQFLDIEQVNREYSPFEFTAKELNEYRIEDADWWPDRAWEEFEKGMEVGARKAIKARVRKIA